MWNAQQYADNNSTTMSDGKGKPSSGGAQSMGRVDKRKEEDIQASRGQGRSMPEHGLMMERRSERRHTRIGAVDLVQKRQVRPEHQGPIPYKEMR